MQVKCPTCCTINLNSGKQVLTGNCPIGSGSDFSIACLQSLPLKLCVVDTQETLRQMERWRVGSRDIKYLDLIIKWQLQGGPKLLSKVRYSRSTFPHNPDFHGVAPTQENIFLLISDSTRSEWQNWNSSKFCFRYKQLGEDPIRGKVLIKWCLSSPFPLIYLYLYLFYLWNINISCPPYVRIPSQKSPWPLRSTNLCFSTYIVRSSAEWCQETQWTTPVTSSSDSWAS